jgi:MoxR-like ATPase
MDARSFVLPDDVKAVAASALAHRVMLAPEMWVRGIDPSTVIQSALGTVPVPSAADAIGPIA